jgi:hypothetical protein
VVGLLPVLVSTTYYAVKKTSDFDLTIKSRSLAYNSGTSDLLWAIRVGGTSRYESGVFFHYELWEPRILRAFEACCFPQLAAFFGMSRATGRVNMKSRIAEAEQFVPTRCILLLVLLLFWHS